MSDERFEGHEGRECGEHRTTGRRAWCFDCGEWCSQTAPCVRCERPQMEASVDALVRWVGQISHDLEHHGIELKCPLPEWAPRIAAAAGRPLEDS